MMPHIASISKLSGAPRIRQYRMYKVSLNSMIRIATVIAAVALILPTSARADWKYAHWGMKPDQLALASGGAVQVLAPAKHKKHPAPWNSETAAEGTYVDGALHVDLSFSFDSKSGGLNCIIFTTAKKAPDKLFKQMFVDLNGPPQKASSSKDLGMETFSWSTAKDEIGLTLMGDGDSLATQCVPGTNPPFES